MAPFFLVYDMLVDVWHEVLVFGIEAVLLIETDELFLKKILNLLILMLLPSGAVTDVPLAEVLFPEFFPDMITDFSFLDYGD